MKKMACVLVVMIVVISFCLTGCNKTSMEEDIIRIHIRANSNADIDQAVKYKVKDEIVKYITPLSKSLENKLAMYNLLSNELDNLEKIADKVLKKEGFAYKSNASLRKEEFPIRSYGSVTVPAGIYDSLIIELGTGKGNNWWCVAYPPLCFIGAKENGEDTFKYKSKFYEIIKNGKR